MFVDCEKAQIMKAIDKSLTDKSFISRITKEKNIYGLGDTSDKILKILKSTVVDDKFMKKMIEY